MNNLHVTGLIMKKSDDLAASIHFNRYFQPRLSYENNKITTQNLTARQHFESLSDCID